MENETPKSHANWQPLPPEHLPRPTASPVGLAMGTTFIFWGLISSWIIFVVGFAVFIAALAGWINEIRHEHKQR